MNAADFLRPKRKPDVLSVDFIAVMADKGSADAVRSLIVDQAMTSSHVQTGSLDDTIELLHAAQRSPRLLMVDVSGSAMPLSELARLAEACDPSVNVIVVGDRNDVGLFRSLLEIGVQDYLVKPLTVPLLQRALTASDPSVRMRTGKAISFIGVRGGVGVTTLAVSMARYLVEHTHRRIAYVDLNLYGGAANALLGMTTNNGLADLLRGNQPLDAPLLEHALTNQGNRLFVLSAELDYGADMPVRPGAVGEVLSYLKHHFHYVLLDLPGRSGRIVEEALDASKHVYIVAERSVYAARECARLSRFIEDRAGEPTVSLLLNHPQEPVPDRVPSNEFKRALGSATVHDVPYAPKALARAENLSEPVSQRQGKAFLSAIGQIAGNLTGSEASAQGDAAIPWYKRLTGRRRTS
ncbi:MAG: AAA family ATPase [Burkholderiales bacterium]|nr:AAA family ATPase [Burkholderiales bacterium]MDE2608380.1 AAA family ATPase [Burkholderiales bacterium]